MRACPCCVTREEIVALTTVPLRSLQVADLQRYAFKALTTWGTSEEYRYFLPRLLELSALFPNSSPVDVETVCGKLVYAHWETWPAEEHAAINDYLLAFWQLQLCDDEQRYASEDYLEAISRALTDLSPFLTSWRESRGAPALLLLASFVLKHGYMMSINGTPGWLDEAARQQQIIDWLLEPETLQQLEDGYFRFVDEPFADEIALAVDTLSILSGHS